MIPSPAGAAAGPAGIRSIDPAVCRRLKIFFTDIDDTITANGLLPASSLEALFRLAGAGLLVVPVTGRPAGWCDHIARFWPVTAVIGENGAFYFSYDRTMRRMSRVFLQSEIERRRAARCLKRLARAVLARFPSLSAASDQPFRLTDFAFDLSEDRPPLGPEETGRVCRFLEARGARFKISSIHLNVWFGNYDKQSCLAKFLADQERAGERIGVAECFYIGDSPNDEPLFAALPHSAGVANIGPYLPALRHRPAFLTERPGASGFLEAVNEILEKRQGPDSGPR